MDPHSDDFELFGIDPDDADAERRLDIAKLLVERGTGAEDIARDSRLRTLEQRIWARIFVGTDELVSLRTTAERIGLDVVTAEEIVRLLGLPVSDETVMVPSDVEALKAFAEFTSVFGEEAARHITRTIGSAMARIAETLTSTTRVGFERPMLQETAYTEFLRMAEPLVGDYFPRLALVMDRVFRYHVLVTSGQSWDVDAEMSAMTVKRAVGFADMVGFTTRAGTSSTRELTLVIDAFENRVSEAIAKHGGRTVKFIGDEVFFSFVEPDAACACALDLLALADDKTMPDVRVGLAFGEMIARGGDYFGPVVNLAARLVTIADAGTAVVSDDLAAHATRFRFEPQEPRQLKGVGERVSYARLTS